MMDNLLKGDAFTNRYRITGTLTTLSPLHIGTGEESDAIYSDAERRRLLERIDRVPLVSTIARDYRGKPLVPGSSLRGVMRHWLLDIIGAFSDTWADTRNYADPALVELSQEQQIEMARGKFSMLERLFGTPFNAGKVEFWDAECKTEVLPSSDQLLHWSDEKLSYVGTSVAIDPATGTALDKLLYKTELVPPGVDFQLNLLCQNLTHEELGLVLFALQGFNSEIVPIQIGSGSGRGYGRMRFAIESVSFLDKSGLKEWIKTTIAAIAPPQGTQEIQAGYYALPTLNTEQQQELIENVKSKLLQEVSA